MYNFKIWAEPFFHFLEKATVQCDGGYSPLIKAPLVFGGIFGATYIGLTFWNNFYRESIEIKRDKLLADLQEKFINHQGLENTATFKEQAEQIEKESETMISQMTFRRSVRVSLASHITSMAHALTVIMLAGYALWTGPHWNDVNTSYQSQVTMWSLGYFLFDTIYLLTYEFSWEFLFHHLISAGFWSSCYYLNRGGYYGMLGLLVGEITNPVQIIWSFARRNNLTKLYNALSPIFTKYFIVVRCIAIPIVTLMMNYHMWHSSTAPIGWRITWIIACWVMNCVSWWWCYILWRGYQKFLKRKDPNKIL